MKTTVASDLHKTIEYLQNNGVNVKVYKYQGKENASSSNKCKEKIRSLEKGKGKATQTYKTVNVTVYKYQPTKGKENASSSQKSNEKVGSSEKVDGKAIQVYNNTSKRQLAQRMRRERERLEGLPRFVPTFGHIQPLIIVEGGTERDIAVQETTRDVLPQTPEQANIVHGEEPTKGKSDLRGIKRNVTDPQEPTRDGLPQTPKGVNIIHGEESSKGKADLRGVKRNLTNPHKPTRDVLPQIPKQVNIIHGEELAKGKADLRGIKRNITDPQEPTRDVLPQTPKQVNIIHGEEAPKGNENANSSNKAEEKVRFSGKEKLKAMLTNPTKGTENASSSSKGNEKVGFSEKVEGKAIQLYSNTSKRKLAQRMRRERERLEGLPRFVPTTRHIQPLIIAEGGTERDIAVQETTRDVLPQTLEPTKGKADLRGIKRNIIDPQEPTRDGLPQSPKRVNIIHGEEPTKGKADLRGIKRNITDPHEPTRDVLPQTPKQVNITHDDEAAKGNENANSSNKAEETVGSSGNEKVKAMLTNNNTSKRMLAQRMRRERERLEALSHVVSEGVNIIHAEEVIKTNPSRRALAQRLRRKRERLECSEQHGATK